MSWINQPNQILIGTEDPEYYAELFSKIPPRLVDRRLRSSCPRVPGIQGVDYSLSQRLQTLLDAVADISLCQRGNVSATMASLKDGNGSLETQLFIVFNHNNDEAAHRCPEHLQAIFNMLRQVPYKPPAAGGSPKLIAKELEDDFVEICRVIHNYSFDFFAYRVTKREHNLSAIRSYIELDQTNFSPEERSTLMEFLDHVAMIIEHVTTAQATKQLPTMFIRMLLRMYSYWTRHNLLLKDREASNKLTLLDTADGCLASSA
jgi:hypothetical protein